MFSLLTTIPAVINHYPVSNQQLHTFITNVSALIPYIFHISAYCTHSVCGLAMPTTITYHCHLCFSSL